VGLNKEDGIMKQYQVLVMSFDGEYKKESPIFDDIDKAWNYADDLGSKWYFYPFVFLTNSKKTIAESPFYALNWAKGKRISTVKRIFKKFSIKPELEQADVFQFADALDELNR
jgi:hypothetical protein